MDCEQFPGWSDDDMNAAMELGGWHLSECGDGLIVIVADEDDEQERFAGENRNVDAHAHVEAVAATGIYEGTHKPIYVEICRRALAVIAASMADDGCCVECGNDLASPSAAGAEDGVCGECIDERGGA